MHCQNSWFLMFILVLKLLFLFISQYLNLFIPDILDPKAPGKVSSCISLRGSSLKYNDLFSQLNIPSFLPPKYLIWKVLRQNCFLRAALNRTIEKSEFFGYLTKHQFQYWISKKTIYVSKLNTHSPKDANKHLSETKKVDTL